MSEYITMYNNHVKGHIVLSGGGKSVELDIDQLVEDWNISYSHRINSETAMFPIGSFMRLPAERIANLMNLNIDFGEYKGLISIDTHDYARE